MTYLGPPWASRCSDIGGKRGAGLLLSSLLQLQSLLPHKGPAALSRKDKEQSGSFSVVRVPRTGTKGFASGREQQFFEDGSTATSRLD